MLLRAHAVGLANWAADMKSIDPAMTTTASVVVKKNGRGAMPGLTAAELEAWTASLLQAARVDILMPQDADADVAIEAWDEKREELAAIFIDFLDRVSVASPV